MNPKDYAGQAAGVIVAIALIYLMADVMRSNRDELIVLHHMITNLQQQLAGCLK